MKTPSDIRVVLKVVLSVIILFSLIGCGKYIDVTTERYGERHDYKVAFEGGYVLKRKGKVRIILKFYQYEKGKYDAFKLLHLYIKGDEAIVNKSPNIDTITAYFANGQLRSSGFMKVTDLKLIEKRNYLSISGEMFIERDGTRKYSSALSFRDIPLRQVNSMHDLLSKSNLIRDTFWEEIKEE